MNRRQKEVLENTLSAEEKELKKLKVIYNKALSDIDDKIAQLMGREDADMQHVVHQVEYQKALREQIGGILDDMNNRQYKNISEYITECYSNGYIGTMYDLHGQGIPVIVPIDPKQVLKALRIDSKISKGLYKKLGEDVGLLKKRIANNIARGFAAGHSYVEIARNVRGDSNIGFNRAMRIARTEGHRVQASAAYDAQKAAKEQGADVVKQWCSVLDGRTRKTHRELDGQLREIDEPFEVGSRNAMYPGDFGRPEEDIHCRCALQQRARWALDEEELETLRERAAYFGLDKTDDFEEFKNKYLQLPDEAVTIKEQSKAFKQLKQQCDVNDVQYRQVCKLDTPLTTEQIVKKISGGDKTKGSCVSLSMTYIANKNNLDVTDFRGGDSCYVFSVRMNNRKLAELAGIKGEVITVKKELKDTINILKDIDIGKEYMLNTGCHSSIIRRINENDYEYLELQHPTAERNGWTSFSQYGSMSETLSKRFGCRKTQRKILGRKVDSDVMLLEVDSFRNNPEFEEILGYINTAADKQQKGVSGSVK